MSKCFQANMINNLRQESTEKSSINMLQVRINNASHFVAGRDPFAVNSNPSPPGYFKESRVLR